MSVLDYIERNFISSKEPQKENLIGCSGGAQTWLWQCEPWQNRQPSRPELHVWGRGRGALGGRGGGRGHFLIPRDHYGRAGAAAAHRAGHAVARPSESGGARARGLGRLAAVN
jgi:hypothetical protein